MSSTAILSEIEKLASELRGRVSHLRTLPGKREVNLDAYDICANRIEQLVAKNRQSSPEAGCDRTNAELQPTGATARLDAASEKSLGATGRALSDVQCFGGRRITDHQINGLNDAITIRPIGERSAGGAHSRYVLELDCAEDRAPVPRKTLDIQFQSRPIKGPNDFDGWTNEALLAVVIDRLRGVQGEPPAHPTTIGLDPVDAANVKRQMAPFACRDNALALTHLEDGLMRLQNRSRDRMRRGVEGKLVA